MEIRSGTSADHPGIRALVDAAFGGTAESRLSDLIRASDRFVPGLALVAAAAGVPVGHVLFSYVTITGEEVTTCSAWPRWRCIPATRGAERDRPWSRKGWLAAGLEKAAPRVPEEAFMVRWLGAPDTRYRGRLVYPPAFHEADASGP